MANKLIHKTEYILDNLQSKKNDFSYILSWKKNKQLELDIDEIEKQLATYPDYDLEKFDIQIKLLNIRGLQSEVEVKRWALCTLNLVILGVIFLSAFFIG